MKKFLRFTSLLLTILIIASLSSCTKISVDSENITEKATDNVTKSTESDTSAVTTEPPKPEKTSVNIRMVGDILLHERVTDSGNDGSGNYNYDHFFVNVIDEIKSADIALVNQEVILGGKELGLTGYPAFNGPFEVGDAIIDAGFDIVLHATNHALDKGSTGINNCLDYWKSAHPGIPVLGINQSYEEQNTVFITENNGIKIAFLNYTYGTNGIAMPFDMPYAVNLLDEAKIRSDVEYAESNADFTVVCPHWGTEYTHSTDYSQDYWTDLFFSLGVDLVIGTHPHVIEPIEMITDDSHSMLVYYSIGNFINSTAETGAGIADRMVGGMADITVERDENGNVSISDYGVIPLVTHVAYGKDMTTYKLSDYTETLAEDNLIVNSDPAFSLEYCNTLAKEVFKDKIK